MDDNTATVIVGVATVIGAAIPAILAAVFSYRANMRSLENAATLIRQGDVLDKVSKQTDGLVSTAIASAQEIAAAREIIARHEGGDEQRKIGEERAIALVAAVAASTPVVPPGPAEVTIVGADVTVPVEIKDKKP